MGTNDNFVLVWLVGGRISAETFLRDTESGTMMAKIAELITSKHVRWVQVWCMSLTGIKDLTMEWYCADSDQ